MNSTDWAKKIRHIILEQSKRAHVGHIGSALSIADIIAVLYSHILNIPSPEDSERDRFVLSKGHAALALYAAFHLKGWLTQEELNTYCADDSRLGVHPEYGLRGVDFATGSLGHGLSMAAGAALAAKLKKSSRCVYVLVSDAELNEGSFWEAVMFAAHHQLSNLVVVIDDNGQQALGFTREVLDLTALPERFKAFGWQVQTIDGHNHSELEGALSGIDSLSGKPHMLIAKTTLGKGVSYMERTIKWHYWPMSDEEYSLALKEIGIEV